MDKIKELKKKAKRKSFYKLSVEERIKNFNETVFNYNDRDIPYITRKTIIKEI